MNHHDYLGAGLRVFSLYSIKNGACGCDDPKCDAVGKHPRASNWQHTPNWSDEQVESMEKYGRFDTGFGVLVKDLLIVDIDPRNGGDESYDSLGMDLEAASGFVVNTGGGGRHIYFKAPPSVSLVTHLNTAPGIDFKSSGYVVGCGSLHASGMMYESKKGHPEDIAEAPQDLIDLLERKDSFRASKGDGDWVDITPEEIYEMLSFYHNDDLDYEEWIRCGMAIHNATQGEGYDIWENWSRDSSKFNPSMMEKKWHSFGKCANPVTIGTLIHHAEQGGYKQSVTFEADQDLNNKLADYTNPEFDLMRPPGFVGEITEWINAQCRFPRERLAVGAALAAMGNVGGLNYEDEAFGATSNQFVFCVAGSSTGKEAVQQAQSEIHRAAGLSPATHGSIKSEQEIIRNLVKHQPALYIIDEMGLVLQKIQNARKRGGAAYLEGVIGTLMSAYSKASSFMLLSGDVREDVKKMLSNEIAKLRRLAEEEGERQHAETIDALCRQLSNIDNGLERPFLSMIGFTTPVTFNDLMDYEQSANGFFGRAIVIQEKETNPRAKKRFKPLSMTDQMKMRLHALCHVGEMDLMSGRIEGGKSRVQIPTKDDAIDRLDEIQDELFDIAEKTKSMSLEAIPRRSFELILKISLTLAIPEGVRTLEHVEWARAFVIKDIEEKITLISANIAQEDKRAGDEIIHRLLSILDREAGMTTGVIYNRCKKFKRDDLDKALEFLSEKKKIKFEVCESRRAKTKTWFLL